MQNSIKKTGANEVLNFADINPRGLKKVTAAFNRNGLEVLNLAATNRKINRNGMTTKKAVFVIAGGQTVELRVNDTGDIYQVVINNKVSPFREQKKIASLIKDIANSVKKNQAAFDKSLLKKITAATRKETKQTQSAGGVSTVAERIEQTLSLTEQLKERIASLTQLNATLDTDIEQLNENIKVETDKATKNREAIAQLRQQLADFNNDKAA